MATKTIVLTITLTGDKIPADVVKTLKRRLPQSVKDHHTNWWHSFLRTKIANSKDVCLKVKEFFNSITEYTLVTWAMDGYYSRPFPEDVQDVIGQKYESLKQELMPVLKIDVKVK